MWNGSQFPKRQFPPRCGQGGNLWNWDNGQSTGGPRFGPTFCRAWFYGSFAISGVTKDATGTPLGGCEVHLFQTGTDIEVGQTTSDGSGNFSFALASNAGWFYILAYKAGGTDLAGVSVNTLTAA